VKPDLVLLDLSMPSLNGAEILKNTAPDVRIIMFTMYSSKLSQSLKSALGIDAFLSKPDDMGHLVESINAVFNSQHN
jgi:DNA-binding NarL/FixJ family response regulator